ncbi:MAG: cysteine dioxygenase family protein [Candidatus Babeliales bacterium]|nr:cysteine dioxygenase family protein [Candidatus Babeliales bacterium]
MLKKFIDQLKEFSKQDFPAEETTAFFKQQGSFLDDLTPYLFFKNEFYTRNLIYYSPEFELVVLCWMPGHKAPAHGHEGEKCWFKVELGSVNIINYDEKDNQLIKLNETQADQGYVDGPAYIHAVENLNQDPAISLHLYARPIPECDVYIDNEKHRKQVGYYSKYGKIIKE